MNIRYSYFFNTNISYICTYIAVGATAPASFVTPHCINAAVAGIFFNPHSTSASFLSQAAEDAIGASDSTFIVAPNNVSWRVTLALSTSAADSVFDGTLPTINFFHFVANMVDKPGCHDDFYSTHRKLEQKENYYCRLWAITELHHNSTPPVMTDQSNQSSLFDRLSYRMTVVSLCVLEREQQKPLFVQEAYVSIGAKDGF
jgi:hypothetical protein